MYIYIYIISYRYKYISINICNYVCYVCLSIYLPA